MSFLPCFMAVSTSLPPRPLAGWRAALRPLFALVLALVLSLGLAACDGSPRAAATLSDETLNSITRQAEGFLAARDRLPELAGLAHLSRTAFFQRFQACMGQTPAEYLQWWRLQLAAQRLRESQDSIAIISMGVGYDDPSAFARAFKRLFGRSPGEFRASVERQL